MKNPEVNVSGNMVSLPMNAAYEPKKCSGGSTRTFLRKLKIVVIGGISCLLIVGCSQEGRDTAMERLHTAGQALNGTAADGTHAVPKIVKEAQRKERIRQNTKWTKENQALHPIEYCQAQVEEVDAKMSVLQVEMHKLSVTQSTLRRKQDEMRVQIKSLEQFMSEAKNAYREAEKSNGWPISFNGFSMTKDQMQMKMVDAAERFKEQNESSGKIQKQLVILEKQKTKMLSNQRRIAKTKADIEKTISNLRTRKVLEGVQDISDEINAISDSVSSLNDVDEGEMSLDLLLEPSSNESVKRKFSEIMAE